jgi:hypothetical protein
MHQTAVTMFHANQAMQHHVQEPLVQSATSPHATRPQDLPAISHHAILHRATTHLATRLHDLVQTVTSLRVSAASALTA